MYLEHFGLREFPFSLAPDPRYLYLSPQHREALAHLLYGVQSEGGFVQLTGEVGTGKTTICRCLLEQLPPGTRVALILNPGLSAEELLSTVCDEFRIPAGDGQGGLKPSLDRINRFLLDVHAAGERAVLIIDEAQTLDAAVLEQVRLLTNLETSRRKLLQIILMGQPELRETLARPDLRQLAQRITARFHLRPLSSEETRSYVRHRLDVAGCVGEPFPPAVIGALRRLSRGVPRVINIICDRALLGAYAQGKREVDRATLARAAREVAGGGGIMAGSWRVPAFVAGGAAVAAAVAVLIRLPASMSLPDAPPPPAAAVAALPAQASQTSPRLAATAPGAPRPPVPVSGVLRALMEQPEAQREQDAWRWLYRLWGVRAIDGENGCAEALAHDLACLRGDGGLEQLRRLNRPAIIRVYGSQGAPRWLAIERIVDRQVTLSAGGARTVVDIGKLEPYGIGEFVLLWRPPPAGLAADRKGDPETMLALDREPAPGTPTLAGRR